MRPALFVAATLAIAAVVPADTLRASLATAASVLVESMPFLLASRVLARVVGAAWATAYAGCGCTNGPAARSIPAGIATWLLFGPWVALARFIAAMLVARLLRHRDAAQTCSHGDENATRSHAGDTMLGDLAALTIPAVLAGTVSQALAAVDPALMNPLASVLAGGMLGFASTPCALGGVALAAAIHPRAPLAAGAFLCVAGIVDAHTFFTRARHQPGADALAYLTVTVALATVALRNGDALVNPRLTPLYAACAFVTLCLFVWHRQERHAKARLAPALALAGALVAAPAPAYRATETTLAAAFPGERVAFLGALSRDRAHDALVRYAIVCCRADAAPIVLRLASRAPFAPGTWLQADGTIAANASGLVMIPQRLTAVTPPADPFVYR